MLFRSFSLTESSGSECSFLYTYSIEFGSPAHAHTRMAFFTQSESESVIHTHVFTNRLVCNTWMRKPILSIASNSLYRYIVPVASQRLSHLRWFRLHVKDPPPRARPNSSYVSRVSAAATAAILSVRSRPAVHLRTVFVERRQSRVFCLNRTKESREENKRNNETGKVCSGCPDEWKFIKFFPGMSLCVFNRGACPGIRAWMRLTHLSRGLCDPKLSFLPIPPIPWGRCGKADYSR